MDRELLKTEKNDVFRYIEKLGLSPLDFEWSMETKDYASSPTQCLSYKHDDYYFLICVPKSSSREYEYKCRPGFGISTSTGFSGRSWTDIYLVVTKWLNLIVKKIEAPNLWRDIAQYAMAVPDLAHWDRTRNTAFTHEEVEQLEEKLQKLLTYLEEQCPGLRERIDDIDARIQSLGRAAKSGVGRIDWTNQFVGFLIQVLLILAASPNLQKLIWEFWKTVFGRFLT